MRRYKGFRSVLFLILGAAAASLHAAALEANERASTSLSGAGWRVWLDKEANWLTDKLYAPGEFNIKELPSNPPTGGWGALDGNGMACTVPASVEEYFSGGVNTWKYHGVSWFWRTFDVPADWKGGVVRLDIERARFRAEIYVNGKLAGYDIVAETPFAIDISRFVNYGSTNQLAVRLTNPGGVRAWGEPQIQWGENELPGSHDFSGIGNIGLTLLPKINVEDVFVKNMPPANSRRIEVEVELSNSSGEVPEGELHICIKDPASGKSLATEKSKITVAKGVSRQILKMSAPDAELWSVESPKLYNCEVVFNGGNLSDRTSVVFGVRTFEVKEGSSGGHNFYLNGKRFFYSSAIDQGYYSIGGFYATDEMARRSVEAAKAVGHKGINLHRNIGEPLVFKYANELGLCLYEEPGGFTAGKRIQIINEGTFKAKVIIEKCRRMVLRDRNHPSLIIYCLANEDNEWTTLRERAMRMFAQLDPTRLVVNSSGGQFINEIRPKELMPWLKTHIAHIRPYEQEIRWDYLDTHNAGNTGARFNEKDFFDPTLRSSYDNRAYYLGEVMSTTGPANWYLVAKEHERLRNGSKGYEQNNYTGNAAKLEAAFKDWNLSRGADSLIKGPADISVQAARGMMYIDARHGQATMVNNSADGYAINGWSPGPQSEGRYADWDSAMCDGARNLKGPAEDYRFWTRPAQVALFRKNGKYFKPNDTVELELNIVNHGLIPAGNYKLKVTAKDGSGKDTSFLHEANVKIEGGECFAQSAGDINATIEESRHVIYGELVKARRGDTLKAKIEESWHGGYISFNAVLLDGEKELANGVEQVLLRNRKSFRAEVGGLNGCVWQWPAAQKALSEASCNPVEFNAQSHKSDFIVAGAVPEDGVLDSMLKKVEDDGCVLLLKFDKDWAAALRKRAILSKDVTEWGGMQTPHWMGNGWGYLEHFVGGNALPGKTVVGTTSWEVPSDPVGFYPLESGREVNAYGVYVARPWTAKAPPAGKADEIYDLQAHMPTMLALLATIEYGKGRIILAPSYHVDEENAFNDLLFYNILSMGCAGKW